jgi:hypothetical protein
MMVVLSAYSRQLLAAFAVLVGGGISAALAQGQPATVDACTLLTQGDLQAIVGQAYTAPPSKTSDATLPLASACSFPNDPPTNPFPVVSVVATADHGADSYAAVQAANQALNPTPLDGVGDAAFVTSAGQVYFLKNGVMVVISVIAPQNSSADILAWTTALAVVAANRL